MFQTSYVIITVPYFRIPARRYEFFLVMVFATDEINENPYLLPNMSLMFSNVADLCQDTLGILDIVYKPENYSMSFINYICVQYDICYIDLTGPSWKTSIKLAFHSITPKVRMCDIEGVNNIKFHLHVPTRNF